MNSTENTKRIYPWVTISIALVLVSYVVFATSFIYTNNTKTERNEADIRELREDFKDYSEKIYYELKEIREKMK